MIDYHIHSSLSADCSVDMLAMATAAQAKGLKDICFTEHIDFDFPSEEDVDFSVDFDAYQNTFEAVSAAFPDVRIRKGIEAGLETVSLDRYPALLDGKDLDFIGASVHIVFERDPYYPSFWQDVDQRRAYDEYMRLLIETAKASEIYDVLSHIGYIAKFCPHKDRLFRYTDYSDTIDILLRLLIERGKGIEVNTNGLLMTPSTMPETAIIRRYHELGGEIITVGSDAHTEEIVGYRVPETLAVLSDIGFRYICAFDARKPRFIPIG